MRRPHIVPLSDQAVELLKRLQALTGKRQWLFPNVRRPAAYMGATTINRVIERMGYLDRFTAHGFRATASTCCMRPASNSTHRMQFAQRKEQVQGELRPLRPPARAPADDAVVGGYAR